MHLFLPTAGSDLCDRTGKRHCHGLGRVDGDQTADGPQITEQPVEVRQFQLIRRLWNSENFRPHFVNIKCWSVSCYVVARYTMHRSHVLSSSGIWRYNSNNNNSNNIAGTVDRRKTKIE